jgi:hypothetical protein
VKNAAIIRTMDPVAAIACLLDSDESGHHQTAPVIAPRLTQIRGYSSSSAPR